MLLTGVATGMSQSQYSKITTATTGTCWNGRNRWIPALKESHQGLKQAQGWGKRCCVQRNECIPMFFSQKQLSFIFFSIPCKIFHAFICLYYHTPQKKKP